MQRYRQGAGPLMAHDLIGFLPPEATGGFLSADPQRIVLTPIVSRSDLVVNLSPLGYVL